MNTNTNTNTNNTRHAKSYSHSTSECDANIRGISNAMLNSGFSINMNLKQNADSENNLNINQLSNHELLGRLEKLVKSERKITHRVLLHINEVELRRLYADLGFDSMYKYLTQHLGYSEDSAYRRLHAARLLNKAPQLAEKLESGALNLTQLTQVQKYIKHEHQEGRRVDLKSTQQILEKIENKSNFETQKLLAHEFNLPLKTQEILKHQRDDSVRLEVTFTRSEMEMLLKTKSAISHSVPDGNWAQVFTYLAEKHLQKEFGKNALEILGISESLKNNKNSKDAGLENLNDQKLFQNHVTVRVPKTNDRAVNIGYDKSNKIEARIGNSIADNIVKDIPSNSASNAAINPANDIFVNQPIDTSSDEKSGRRSDPRSDANLDVIKEGLKKSKIDVEASSLLTQDFMVMRNAFDTHFQSGKKRPIHLIRSIRKPIKISIKRELFNRAGYCCQFVDPVTGKKCESVYQLQIDHRVPLAKNGSNDISNLQVLCRTHNLHLAHKWGLL